MVPELKPICFVVMPFGKKPVPAKPPEAPDAIDFDALWQKALLPVIQELGYDPVRADQDTGSAIILEMLERLFFSDLVVADMTIPNGNVYYEIGIRHASRRTGCVLMSADWARPLFDTAQMRRVIYRLPEGAITDATAAGIRDDLKRGTAALADGTSPVFEHIPGFPDPQRVDPARASSIRTQLEAIAAFQARVTEARVTTDPARRKELASTLRAEYGGARPMSQAVALEMVTMIRDCLGWTDMAAYIDSLPRGLRDLNVLQEQRCLAQSKSGDHEIAIGALQALIGLRGDSSERQGLLGGRYKQLAAAARAKGDTRAYENYLDQAIDHYERGMKLDLNDFYPSSNLPFLYRQRGSPGDDHQARVSSQLARLACERDAQNPWAKPTLLTLAFFDEDGERAQQYAREVRRQGPATWQLETTIGTLERSVDQVNDPEKKAALASVLADLKRQL